VKGVLGSRFITVLPSGAPSGHKLSNCSARAGFRLGSTVGYNLLVIEEQCVRPIVCAPAAVDDQQTKAKHWHEPCADKEKKLFSCSMHDHVAMYRTVSFDPTAAAAAAAAAENSVRQALVLRLQQQQQ
jgi:hypothetical protein